MKNRQGGEQDMDVHEKMDEGTIFADFGQYLSDTPGALMEMAQLVGGLDGGLHPHRLAALAAWAGQMGKHLSLVKTEEGWALDLGSNDGQQVFLRADPGQEGDGDQAPGVKQQHLDEVLAAEKTWFACGPSAPVVEATFLGQFENDFGDIDPSNEESRCVWDATNDMASLLPSERNDACQMDSYESDALREMSQAPSQAADWEGPFAVSVRLGRPGPKLRSLREAAFLSWSTDPSATSSRRHRL